MTLLSLMLINLSTITGVKGTVDFSIQSSDNYKVNSLVKGISNKDISDTTIYNLYGENQYKEIYENNKYFIIDQLTSEKIAFTVDAYPFLNFKENLKLLFNFNNTKDYVIYLNDNFYDAKTLKTYDFTKLNNYLNENRSSEAGKYEEIDAIPSSANTINSLLYFLRLRGNHPENKGNTCSLVSTSIILGFYDTKYNDRIVFEDYENYVIEEDKIFVSQFSQSPGTNDELHTHLSYMAESVIGRNPNQNGMNGKEQINTIKEYIKYKTLKFEMNTSEGNFADLVSNRAVNIIKNAIDNNRPVIANGTGHSSVAVGYDDEYVYVHPGWGHEKLFKTSWNTYKSSAFSNYSASAIDLVYKGNHPYHSNNYRSYTNNGGNLIYVCSCGYYGENINI